MPKLAAFTCARENFDFLLTAKAALDLGFDSIVVAAPLRQLEWEPLREMLPRDATASIELFLPLPSSLPHGSPMPFQAASLDTEDRREALKQGLATLIEAERKDVPLVHIPPIELEARLREEWFSLRAGQPFVDERRAQILSRRAKEAPLRLDSFKGLLGRLLESAERYGRRIAIIPGGFPDEVPSLREAQ